MNPHVKYILMSGFGPQMLLSFTSFGFLICASEQKKRKKKGMIKTGNFFQLARNRKWKKLIHGEGKKLIAMRDKEKL